LTNYSRVSANYDVLLICNTGTYTYPNGLPATAMNFTNVGTDDCPLLIQGADASGNSYEGTSNMVTLDGSADTGMTAGNAIFNITTANSCLLFRNIHFKSAKSHGVSLGAVCNPYFIDCRFSYAGGSGFYTNTTSATPTFHRCRMDHNAAWGFYAGSSARGRGHFNECVVDNNTSGGICDSVGGDYAQRCRLWRTLIFKNGGPGLYILGASGLGGLTVQHCTFFGNSGHGIDLTTSAAAGGNFIIEGCIFSNSANAMSCIFAGTSSAVRLDFFTMRNCCSYNSGSGAHLYVGGGAVSFPGSGHVYEDPSFVNTTSGSEDLTPQNLNLRKSLANGAGGTCYFWIGGVQPALTVYTGSSGGSSAPSAADVADAVLAELVSDHSSVSGSLAAALAGLLNGVNLTKVNGSSFSLASGLATGTDLAAVAANVASMISSGVLLAASQTLYAPSKDGAAMALTATERGVLADAVLAELVSDHSSVSGSLAAALSTLLNGVNLTKVNGNTFSLASGLATESALSAVANNVASMVSSGVLLAASQSLYAPAKDGSAMALTTPERAALSARLADEALSGHSTAGTLGKALYDLAAGAILMNLTAAYEKAKTAAQPGDEMAVPSSVTEPLGVIQAVAQTLSRMISNDAFTTEAMGNVSAGGLSHLPTDKPLTVTCTDSSGNKVFGVLVRVCRDFEGSDVTDAWLTDDSGKVTFWVTPGVKYYVFRKHSSVRFVPNPMEVTVN
jgi:hypothetical protein